VPKLNSPVWGLPSRQDLQDVASAWEKFVTGQDQQLTKVRPTIRASWQRATRLGVDPYLPEIPLICSAEEVERMQEQADLVYVAAPVFDMLAQALEKEQLLISISDRQRLLLHQSGHPWVLERAMEINGVPGGGMAEEHVGTAALPM